jgi:hypothetical protein
MGNKSRIFSVEVPFQGRVCLINEINKIKPEL